MRLLRDEDRHLLFGELLADVLEEFKMTVCAHGMEDIVPGDSQRILQ